MDDAVEVSWGGRRQRRKVLKPKNPHGPFMSTVDDDVESVKAIIEDTTQAVKGAVGATASTDKAKSKRFEPSCPAQVNSEKK